MIVKKWNNKKILAVEDDEVSIEFMKELFEPYNVELITASDGKTAMELCATDYDIEIVLMDVQLPILNGKEAMQNIKRVRPDLPIIAQTAFAMSGDREKYLNVGFDDYISKPININELIEILDKTFA